MKRFLLLFFVVVTSAFPQEKIASEISSSSSHVAEYNPIDVQHYTAKIQLDMLSRTISGTVQILAQLESTEKTSFFLHLIGLDVSSATIDGTPVPFQQQSERVYFTLENPAQLVSIQLDYAGTPGNDGFGGFFFNSGYVYTMGEAINTYPPSALRYWIPSHDVPDDKATLDLFITVPTGLSAFSNGLLNSVKTEGDLTTYHWSERFPIATYLIAIAVGDYFTFDLPYISVTGDSLPIEFYVFPEDSSKAQEDWNVTSDMMYFFERFFSPYPFDRYSMVEAFNRGAMEHQGMTTYSYRLVTGDHRYDYIVAHELAHHWWGNLITLGDWRDIWLNEGFATYSEALYFEWKFGDSYLSEYMDSLAPAYFNEVARRGHFPIYDPDYLWGGTIYQKGAWVLHMLRWAMGDTAFWNTLHTYIDTYAYGNALITDFQDIAEQESGQDLDWFFDQWIYQAGYPDLDIAWNITPTNNSYTTIVTVEQKQWDQFQFVVPLEINFTTSSGPVLDTLYIDQRKQTFELEFSAVPTKLNVDPDNWLLKQYDIISTPLPPGFTPNDFHLAQNYPNPFTSSELTQITYQVAQLDAPHDVQIKIYNILGQEVKTLVDREMPGGLYTISWDGTNSRNKTVPSGVYLYRLKSKDKILEKKLLLTAQ